VIAISLYYVVDKSEPTIQEAIGQSKTTPQKDAFEVLSNERIAYYTKVLALITGGLAFFGVVQAYFLIRADETARLSARAALDSADALRAEQRAFVFRDSFDVNPINNQLIIFARWRNSGSTPTRNMTNYVNWRPFIGEMPKDFSYPDLDKLGNTVGPDVALTRTFAPPNGTTLSESLTIPTNILDDLRTGQKRIFVWGWTKYEDVFGGHHVTRFCNEVKIVSADAQSLAPGAAGQTVSISVSFPIHSRYNCTDEECKIQGFP
jgi:hypothetical protein